MMHVAHRYDPDVYKVAGFHPAMFGLKSLLDRYRTLAYKPTP